MLGDSGLILPTQLVILVVLLILTSSRILAVQWAVLFGITGLVVCLSKLAFMGWGIGIAEFNFTGFSGHSALSAAFWPVFLWLMATAVCPGMRFGAAIMGYFLAGLVGYSRLVINAHSASEVIAGLALGALASSTFFILQAGKTRRLAIPRAFLFIFILPLCLLIKGEKAPTQFLLGEIALMIGPRDTIYTREEMLHTLPICIAVRCEP